MWDQRKDKQIEEKTSNSPLVSVAYWASSRSRMNSVALVVNFNLFGPVILAQFSCHRSRYGIERARKKKNGEHETARNTE